MASLRNLILYSERFHETPVPSGVASVRNHMNILSEDESVLIFNYMDRCERVLMFMGNTFDPLTGKWDIPHSVITDGVYVWDEIILRWVKRHRIRLPVEFVEHVHNTLSNAPPDQKKGCEYLLEKLHRCSHATVLIMQDGSSTCFGRAG